jgi:hypothetical protein
MTEYSEHVITGAGCILLLISQGRQTLDTCLLTSCTHGLLFDNACVYEYMPYRIIPLFGDGNEEY